MKTRIEADGTATIHGLTVDEVETLLGLTGAAIVDSVIRDDRERLAEMALILDDTFAAMRTPVGVLPPQTECDSCKGQGEHATAMGVPAAYDLECNKCHGNGTVDSVPRVRSQSAETWWTYA